jgi:diguanylate cyclase (GGDEF)-like protein
MPGEQLRILILEDTLADAEACRQELERNGLRFVWRRVDTRDAFEHELESFHPDLILSDFTLSSAFDGLKALDLAIAKSPGTPFVFLSGTIGEERAVDAIRRGASDYVLKERLVRLGPAVRQALAQAELRRAVARAEERISRLNRVHAVLSSINSTIVRVRERQVLFSEACRIAVEHGRFGMVWIGLLDPQSLDVTPVAWAGADAEGFLGTAKSSAREDHPHGQGVVGRAIRSAAPLFSNDLLAEGEAVGFRAREAARHGYQSRIALPLRMNGSVAGIMVLFAKEKGFFNEEELKLLGDLAANISFAMSHIAAEEKVEKLSRIRAIFSLINSLIVRVNSRQDLFDEACRIAVQHGGFGIAWIGILDPETLEIVPAACAGVGADTFLANSRNSARADAALGSGVAGRAVREKRATYSNDLLAEPTPGGARRREALRRGYRSVIVVPLLVEGAVSGIFSLFAREPDFFDDEEVGLLTELAGNISFALEHIARSQKVEKLSRMRSVSSEINIAIVRVRDRDDLLREACRIASEQGRFEMIWIGAIDADKQEVKPVAWTGFTPETAHAVTWASITTVAGPLGDAIRTRKVAVRNDIESELLSGNLRREALARGCRSTVCVPLVEDDRVVALASLYATGRGFFDRDELTLLEEVASNIAFALESIARQEKIERLSRIRLVLGEINAAIVRIRNRQELFDEACRIAVDAGRFKFAWLGVVDREAKEIRPVAHAGVAGGFLEGARPFLDEAAPRGPGLSARAVLGKTPVIVNDTQSDPRIQRREEHRERNINSIAMFPLLVGGEAIGVLALHADDVGFFDEEEVKLLSELASDIAFALQTIEKEEKLEYLSFYDTLTGLPNRTLFLDRIGQQLRARGGEAVVVAVILINLQRFRNINETFGRHGGDNLLKQVAQRLEEGFRGKDHLARTTADGFGIIMRGMRDAASVAHTVDTQVLECFRKPFVLAGSEVRVAAKAGIAMFPADGRDADTLFKNAEAALKRAREAADRFLFYASEMTARAALVLSLETRLRKAVEAQQFVLHYQPKVAIPSGAVCGLEALIRWQEPGAGLVPPGTFIPVLEETGLILEVGSWVLRQALSDHREWAARGCAPPRIAVNVSAIQLQQRDFTDIVIQAVHQAGDNTAALELEVTESLLMRDVEGSIRKLSLLRATGIHIAMDDFGTGYSSLSYIARLPINSVKIDRSFVNGMAGNDQDMAIVTTIVTLAHSLNLRVVAEGVETEGQSRLLALLKCDEAQGYFFGRPVPAQEIEPWLRERAAAPGTAGAPAARNAAKRATRAARRPSGGKPSRRK